MRKIEQISISAADRERLERLVRDRNTPQKVVWRSRIVLLASDGLTAAAIATAVGKSLLTVRRWRRRYIAKGVDGLLKDATRPSRRKPLTAEKIKQVVHMTLSRLLPRLRHRICRRRRDPAHVIPVTNVIESSFATIRHRTVRSKGCLSNKTALAMIYKLAEAAEKSWRRLDGHNQLPKVILGVKFTDGIEVVRSQAQGA
jgi:hypothetical protein